MDMLSQGGIRPLLEIMILCLVMPEVDAMHVDWGA